MGVSGYLLFNGSGRLVELREEAHRVASILGDEGLADEIYRLSLEIMDKYIVNANPASLVRAVAYVVLRRRNEARRAAAALIDTDDSWMALIDAVEGAIDRINGDNH